MSNLARAIAIAATAHQEQRDKAGAPYVLHPIRMMLRMNTEVEMMAAVLHDVIEDTPWTLEQLQAEGFSEEVVAAVDCLSHRPDEPYSEFIERIRSNHIAMRVKLADIEDNMDFRRIKNLTERDLRRVEKYHHYWKLLKEMV
ncbi:MAG: HD domain-containing protein [Blastocatellia bacterium]|nr:HD domain-containing protein [Blastocatellia bacterium]